MYQYDEDVRRLAAEGKGGRLIAKELGIAVATAHRVMKRLDLITKKKNQHQEIPRRLEIKFTNDGNLEDAAESYFKYLCELSGFEYCTPSRRAPYDLLVDFGDGFRKIQIKSSRHERNGSIIFSLVRKRNNSTSNKVMKYSKSDVDYFFLFSEDKQWLIPFSGINNVRAITPENRFANFEI